MQKRRLAAIMFSDIVGYASLLKEDEKKAYEARRLNQRIHRRLIKKFKGQSLKEMGTGILASFNSNVDAVMCAVAIQHASDALNLQLRIGIHQGDVIFEKKDVLGDGVNMASRIQNSLGSGGIAISEKVYSDLKNKEGLIIEYQGEETLKGIDIPVGLYRVSCDEGHLPDYSVDTGELVRSFTFSRTVLFVGILLIGMLVYMLYFFFQEKIKKQLEPQRSILVLPFDNFTGSDTLEYFTAGMHDALIGEIGKIGALQVKSKKTAYAYKNVDKSVPEIASELGVNVVIEGSVLCIGDSVCLQVRMVDTEDAEKQLWAHDFKVERSHIQNLYSHVTMNLSDEINVILSPNDEKRLSENRLVDPVAYDLYMKGLVYNDQMSEDALQRAAQYFKLANEQDPTWAPPYMGMASVLERQYQMGFIDRSYAMPRLSEYIDRAIDLDPNSSWVYNLRGSKAAWFEWNWVDGEQDFLKSIELNPNHAGNHAFYAGLLSILRRTEEAIEHAEIAEELDPLNPFILGICASVYIDAGECQKAMDMVEKAISIEPNHYFTYPIMIEAAKCMKDYKKAFEVMKEINLSYWERFGITEQLENKFLEEGWPGLQKELIRIDEEQRPDAGPMDNLNKAGRYISIGEYDKALHYLELIYDAHSPNLPSISRNRLYNRMQDNPKYITLLKKMNLPVE